MASDKLSIKLKFDRDWLEWAYMKVALEAIREETRPAAWESPSAVHEYAVRALEFVDEGAA